ALIDLLDEGLVIEHREPLTCVCQARGSQGRSELGDGWPYVVQTLNRTPYRVADQRSEAMTEEYVRYIRVGQEGIDKTMRHRSDVRERRFVAAIFPARELNAPYFSEGFEFARPRIVERGSNACMVKTEKAHRSRSVSAYRPDPFGFDIDFIHTDNTTPA